MYLHGIPNVLDGQGLANWGKLAGPGIDQSETEAAARIIGQDLYSIDSNGYQVEIIAGIPHPSRQEVAYVESRAKYNPKNDYVAVNFRLIRSGPNLPKVSWTIKSYNQFFGCNVRFLDWFEDCVVFIYREKHRTHICSFSRQYPFYRFWKKHTAVWTKIGDMWVINSDRLGYWDRRGNGFGQLWTINGVHRAPLEDNEKECSKVYVIRLPSLDALPPLSLKEAEIEGLKPKSF